MIQLYCTARKAEVEKWCQDNVAGHWCVLDVGPIGLRPMASYDDDDDDLLAWAYKPPIDRSASRLEVVFESRDDFVLFRLSFEKNGFDLEFGAESDIAPPLFDADEFDNRPPLIIPHQYEEAIAKPFEQPVNKIYCPIGSLHSSNDLDRELQEWCQENTTGTWSVLAMSKGYLSGCEDTGNYLEVAFSNIEDAGLFKCMFSEFIEE